MENIENAHNEIERKFLMTGFLNKSDFNKIIEGFYKQFYLSISPEVRFREDSQLFDKKLDFWTTSYLQEIKSSGNLSRREIPIGINSEQYEEVLKIVNKSPIHKYYKIYKFGNRNFAVCHVDNEWFYGEIEFDTEEEANAWVIPEKLKPYITKEVTYDPNYKMKNYWKRTRLNKE